MAKAFDTVYHTGLLHKLQSSGITGDLLEWVRRYLTDRRQRVVLNGSASERKCIDAGFPQGSILGPLYCF